jgi:serine/threonine-protein kinase
MPEQDDFPESPAVGGADTEPDPLLDRVLVGKFRLERLLGVGAMGRVYRAEHLSLTQKIAVKVLHQHLTGDESLARRFHREAKSAFTLNHPNSITIMDFGQDDDGLLYIAMELLEGRSLHDVIHEDGPLALERTVRILDQVCLALDEAHHQKIVHRDLKPENIMIQHRRGEPDFVKVCDFGIAKVQDASGESAITMAGMVCGTPEYMSPEQARGEPLDGRSDLYSLAVILYQMVTARLPFTAETALGCVTKHLTEQPPRPSELRPDLDIPPILEEFILRGLAKDPDQRPPSVAAFHEELAEIAHRVGRGETDAPVGAAPATGDTAPAQTEAPEAAPPRRTGGARWALPAALARPRPRGGRRAHRIGASRGRCSRLGRAR